MTARTPNDRLARLMDEAGFSSHKAFARAVMAESQRAGEPLRHCDHTYVTRWLNGHTPQGKTPVYIASALARALKRRVTVADVGMPFAGKLPAPGFGLIYPETPADATDGVVLLWQSDLGEATVVQRARVDSGTWNEASLRWLVEPGRLPSRETASGVRIGMSDVDRFRSTIEMFAQLDDRYGGGHARYALIAYLSTDGERLLRGRCSEPVARASFSAVAEAMLLAGWMAYDSAPASGLAQWYYVQALGIAQAAGDRLLGAGILDAMSHQATYNGRFGEAANLARAARAGTSGLATATLTAHFHTMEARALARLSDPKACTASLHQAVQQFDRSNPEADPAWFQHFDQAELEAEFGHCLRDVGRPAEATEHVSHSLAAADPASFMRSDFFAAIVLADAYLAAGDACGASRTTRGSPGMPAEAVVVNGGQHQVPFTRADREPVKVDDDGLAVPVTQDIADARVPVNHALRQHEFQARKLVPQVLQPAGQKLAVGDADLIADLYPVLGVTERGQQRKAQAAGRRQRVQLDQDLGDLSNRRVLVRVI